MGTLVSAAGGSLGFAKQTTKGTPVAASSWMPFLEVDTSPVQNVQVVPPEVGGVIVPHDAYKTGVIVQGQATCIARGDALGFLLANMAGLDTVTGDGATLPYSHKFTMAANSASTGWLTITKNVAGVITEQYVDCRVTSVNFELAAEAPLQVRFNFVGISFTSLANPTETFDSTPILTACTGVAKLGTLATPHTLAAIGMSRASVTFSNQIPTDLFTIGSYNVEDLPVLYRTGQAQFSARLNGDDATYPSVNVYKAAMFNSIGAAPLSWSPTVFIPSFSLAAKSATNIPGVSPNAPYELDVVMTDMAMQGVAMRMQGNQIISIEASGQMVLSAAAADTFIITLKNATAAAYI